MGNWDDVIRMKDFTLTENLKMVGVLYWTRKIQN